jgi:hypothetical protein
MLAPSVTIGKEAAPPQLLAARELDYRKPIPDNTGVMGEKTQSFPLLPCVLAWIVPGTGHLYLGKKWRGLLFLLAIPVMFGIGMFLGGKLYQVDPAHPLTYLAVFANLGNGLFYFVARYLGGGEGRILDVTYEYGCTFALVSGLMNFLIVLDAYDIAVGRKA